MFKERLKELRQKDRLSQYEFADKIFVSRSVITMFLSWYLASPKNTPLK